MPLTSKKISTVEKLFENNRLDAAADEMMTWQPASLALFYLDHTPLQTLLIQQEFRALWQTKLSQLKCPRSPDFHFMTQPRMSNASFVLGYVFYLLALQAKQQKNPINYLLYLKTSLLHHSIHAHQTFLQELVFDVTREPAEKVENIAHNLLNLEALAAMHGTPGYLMLANAYLQLAKISSDIKSEKQEQAAYFFTWKNLQLAQLCRNFSDEAINNAYFGQDLALSNPFGFTSIQEMILGCSSIARGMLKAEDKSRAEAEAKQVFKVLVPLLEAEERNYAAAAQADVSDHTPEDNIQPKF